jgi:hypothetical protein
MTEKQAPSTEDPMKLFNQSQELKEYEAVQAFTYQERIIAPGDKIVLSAMTAELLSGYLK